MRRGVEGGGGREVERELRGREGERCRGKSKGGRGVKGGGKGKE